MRLLAKKPWHRFEFAADARRAWMQFRPAHAPTLEETVAAHVRAPAAPPRRSRRGRSAARSLAAGIARRSARRRWSPATTSGGSCWRSWTRSCARDGRAAPAGRAHRGGRRRQEPPRRVALRGGPRARHDGAAARALRPHAVAARRRDRRGQRALRARGGRPRARRADAHQPLGGREGRRRRAHLGRRRPPSGCARRRPARSAASGRRGSASSSTRPSSASSSSRESSSASARPPGPHLVRRPALRVAEHLRDALAPPARRAEAPPLIVAHRAQRDARDRSRRGRSVWRRSAPSGAGACSICKPLGDRGDRGAPPRDAPAPRRRVARGGRAEPRQPALRAAAPPRVGGRRLPHDRGRRVPRARSTRSRGARSRPPSSGTSACARCRRDCGCAAYAAAALGDDVRGDVLKTLVRALGMDPRDALVALTRAQILLAVGERPVPLAARAAARAPARAPPRAQRRAGDLPPRRERAREAPRRRVAPHHEAPREEPAPRGRRRRRGAAHVPVHRGGVARAGATPPRRCSDLALLEGRVTGPPRPSTRCWRAEALRHIGRARRGARAGRDVAARLRASRATRRARRTRSGCSATSRATSARRRRGGLQVALALARFEQLEGRRGRARRRWSSSARSTTCSASTRGRARSSSRRAQRCAPIGDMLGRRAVPHPRSR